MKANTSNKIIRANFYRILKITSPNINTRNHRNWWIEGNSMLVITHNHDHNQNRNRTFQTYKLGNANWNMIRWWVVPVSFDSRVYYALQTYSTSTLAYLFQNIYMGRGLKWKNKNIGQLHQPLAESWFSLDLSKVYMGNCGMKAARIIRENRILCAYSFHTFLWPLRNSMISKAQQNESVTEQ